MFSLWRLEVAGGRWSSLEFAQSSLEFAGVRWSSLEVSTFDGGVARNGRRWSRQNGWVALGPCSRKNSLHQTIEKRSFQNLGGEGRGDLTLFEPKSPLRQLMLLLLLVEPRQRFQG